MRTPRAVLARWVAVATCCLPLSGCGTYSIPQRSADHDPDQPWFGPGGRAKAYYEVHSDMVVRRDETLHWASPELVPAQRLDAGRVVYDCDNYLRSRGIEHKPERLMADGTPLQPPADGHYITAPLLRFPITARIVCLDPVMVILVPIRNDVSTLTHPEHWGILETGYLGSTRCPYHPEVQWFSPTLQRGPEAVAATPGLERRQIDVPWGRLLLTHEGNEWVVTGEKP